MAQLPHGPFNASEVEPSQSFDPLPTGKYLAFVSESEIKPTQKGDGSYLQLVWEVADGEYKGRKVWDRLNLVNPNQTAVEIAYRTLSAICHAAGKITVQDSAELHGIPCVIKLKIKQSPGRDPQNEISGYESRAAATTAPAPAWKAPTTAPTAAPTMPPPAAAAPAKTPPWARSAA